MEIDLYNPDITHCRGIGSRQCGRCYRRELFRMWLGGDTAYAGAVLIMGGAGVEGSPCPAFYSLDKLKNRYLWDKL